MKRPIVVLLACFIAITLIQDHAAWAVERESATAVSRRRYVVALSPATKDVAAVAAELAKAHDGKVLTIWRHAIKGFWVEISDANAAALANDKRVRSVELDVPIRESGAIERTTGPNGLLHGVAVPNPGDPLWHLTRISHRAPTPATDEAAYYTYRALNEGLADDGRRVTVYVIDGGVMKKHHEFTPVNGAPRDVVDGFNAASQPDLSTSVPADPMKPDLSSSIAPCQDNIMPISSTSSHGTAVASLINGVNVGVARDARVVSVNVTACDSAANFAAVRTTATLISGVNWVAQDALLPEPGTNQPKLAVLSISTVALVEDVGAARCQASCITEPALSVVESAFKTLTDLGITVVASANNQGADACSGIPARLSRRGGKHEQDKPLPRVITVGGTTPQDTRWAGSREPSNMGQCVDIWAPGVDVTVASSAALDGYRLTDATGTSFSAPIVAGIVARMLADDPSLAEPRANTVDKVWQRLALNATHLHTDLGTGSPELLAYVGPLIFTEVPASQRVASGSDVTVHAAVSNDTNVTYRWYRGTSPDVANPIGEGSTLTFKVCTAAVSGCTEVIPGGQTYWVRATREDLIGSQDVPFSADSDAARIDVSNCHLPHIDQQPESIWVKEGEAGSHDLQATVTANASFLYRWQRWRPDWSTASQSFEWVENDDTLVEAPAGGGSFTKVITCPTPVVAGVPLYYYRLVLTGTGSCGAEGAPQVVSDTAQLRVCAPPVIEQPVHSIVYDAYSSDTTESSELQAVVNNATQYRWLYSSNPTVTPHEQLRVELPDGGWENFRTPRLKPPFPGVYALQVGNSCDSVTTQPINIVSVCDIQATIWRNGGRYGTAARFSGSCGRQETVLIRVDHVGPARQPAILWHGVTTDEVTTVTVPNDTLNIVVNGYRKITATIKDPASGCERSVVVEFDCTGSCGNSQPAFQLLAGQCSVVRSPTYRAKTGGVVYMTPYVVHGTEKLDNSQFSFEWRKLVGSEYQPLSDPLAADGTLRRIVTGAETFELIARRHLPDSPEECDRITVRIEPIDGTCFECTSSCRRHAAPLVNGAAVSAVTIPRGTSLVLTPPEQEAGSRYEWHRSTHTVSDRVFSTETSVTVAPLVDTSYFVVTTTASNELIFSDSVYVTVSGSAAIASPATQAVPAGALVTIVASIPDTVRLPGTTYAWYHADDVDGTQPRVGTDAVLTLNAPADDASYWCRITHEGRVYDTNLATIIVTCGETVFGTILTNPVNRRVARGQSPWIQAEGTGKALTYVWHQRSPNGTATVAGIGPVLRPVPIEAETWYSVTAEDSCGTGAVLGEVSIYLCVPTIDTHPQSVTVAPGATATLIVIATPAITGQALTIKWYRASDTGRTSPLGTGATFNTILPAGAIEDSFVAAITSNCAGSPHTIVSNPATVAVCASPTVVSNSVASITGPGQAAVLSVDASGRGVLTYQWFVGSTGNTASPIGGETSHYLTVSPTTTTNYWCRVTSDGVCATDGPTIPVPVCSNPTIITQPASQTTFNGTSTTLTVGASAGGNTSPLGYQWQIQSGTGWSSIAGATSSSFVTPILTAATTYRVVVSAGQCSTVSSPAAVALCTYPAVVTASPEETQTTVGEAVVLRLPQMNPVYDKIVRWYEGESGDRTTVAGGGTLNATLAISPTATRKFWAEFTHGDCTSRTTTYTIRVCKPAIVTQPVDASTPAGTPVTLSVVATALAGQTYQWFKGAPGTTSMPVAGATSAAVSVSPSVTTTYWVRITGTCGTSVDSAAATVLVCTPPSIGGTSPTTYIKSGSSAAISVTASGSNLSYQWYSGASGMTTNPIPNTNGTAILVSPSATASYWVRVSSEGLCTVNSPAILVDVCTTPVITNQPVAQPIASGTSATLTVTTPAAGATYQWYVGASGAISSPIVGATNATLTVSPATDTQYWARVTRGACSADSAAATITVCKLNVSVAGANLAAGQTATLAATVSNPRGALQYAWYRGNSGDTTNLFATSAQVSVTPATSTNYWVRVTDGTCTAASATATVSLCVPVISVEPQSALINNGTTRTLSVTASAAQALSYQWYVGDSGVMTSPIAGATSSSYTSPPLTASTKYWVRVLGCSAVNSATAVVTVCTPPAITSGPAMSNTNYPSNAAWIAITASGTNLSYQWFRGVAGNTSQPVSGATLPTYNFTLSTSEKYWVRVTGSCGSVDSPDVLYSVTPSITSQPQSVAVPANATATLSVVASGTYLQYQWYQGAVGTTTTPMQNGTGATFVTPPVTGSATYWCKVTSGGSAAAASNAAMVTLCVGPHISSFSSQYQGSSSWKLQVSVGSADVGNVKYQWYVGVPGDVAASTPDGTAGLTAYRYITPASNQTWWVRVWYANDSCYSDTSGRTIYPVN